MFTNLPDDPQHRFWTTAARVGALSVVLAAGFRVALSTTGASAVVEFVLGAAYGLVLIAAAVLLVRLGGAILRRVPAGPLSLLLACGIALATLTAQSPLTVVRRVASGDLAWPLGVSPGVDAPSLLVVVFAVALGVALAVSSRDGTLGRLDSAPKWTLIGLTAGVSVVAALVVAHLASVGRDPHPSDFRTLASASPASGAMPNPAAPGPHTVRSLTYGAGENRRLLEFGADRDLESRTVDASSLLEDWKDLKQRSREWYWGFGLDEAPLNARVWLPDGDGPFPLVLIVHGNHAMEDYSDAGYAYLGELLASRGLVAVSLDQNYINGTWSGDFRGKEMPLRAWLMLEHLALWRDWQTENDHPLGARVDLANIALIGHSRGGEAVSMAYAFNNLDHYPDDATIEFDYNFAIRSLVAIAQVDQRYHRRVELNDVNFLTLHGSYDSDEPAYHGMRQYHRIALGRDEYRFKAGIYVHGANHGQFNSTWGREDMSPPGSWLLNLAPIIPAEQQRDIAKVYISAFLDATLKRDARFMPLFKDPRAGSSWLPNRAYVSQFTDSTFEPIADFEDDLDVTTGAAGVRIAADGFALWREEELEHRDERKQGTSAVVLGWRGGSDAVYEIQLSDTFWAGKEAADVLTLSVTGSTEKVPAEDEGSESDEESDADAADPTAGPVFTIESVDSTGAIRRVRSDAVASIAPPLKVRYFKSERRNKDAYNTDWDPVLQTVDVPIADLSEPRGGATISRIRLRFGGAEDGVVIVDDIGLRSRRN